jgi:phage terminase small subunit
MDDKPKLTLVKGEGKGKSRSGNKATPSALTEKQERFAQCLAEGMTNTEAYRAAYDTSKMQSGTVHNEASRLAQHHPGITARLNELLAEKRAKNSMLSEKQADRVWRNVWRLAEGDNVPPAVQQSALALAAKMAGMLTDKLEVKQETADSKTIEAELIQRLQRLKA